MRKTLAIAIIAIFIFSLIPFSIAEEGSNTRSNTEIKIQTETKSDDTNTSTNAETKTEVRIRERVKDDQTERRTEIKEKAEEKKDKQRERLKVLRQENRVKIEALHEDKVERLINLSNERLQKIAELDKRQIERLAELDIRNLEKISELKKERLERISNLSEEKLDRLIDLEKDKLEKASDLNETELDKFSTLDRARLKEIAKLDHARLKAELKELRVVKIKDADDLDRRNISEEERTELRERFEKARDEFKEAKDELEDARKKLKEAKEQRRDEDALTHAKTYLLRTAEALINHLEKLEAKVQESKNIPDEREAKIVAEIDTQIAEINAIKAEIEAATTKEQIKEAAKKLRVKWNRLKNIIRLHAERVVSARVEGLVNQGLVLEKRLDHVLAKAKEKGIEVDVSAEINAFSEKIALSREKYKQAQVTITEAFELREKGEPADSENIKALMDEANQLLKDARSAIKEAHGILKTVVKKIRAAYPEADLSEEVEVEVVQEPSVDEATVTTEANVTAETSAGA